VALLGYGLLSYAYSEIIIIRWQCYVDDFKYVPVYQLYLLGHEEDCFVSQIIKKRDSLRR